jgi:hypothetical protein
MTDRELLEAAAKAAGLTIHLWADDDYPIVIDDTERMFGWQPLRFCSDALRLAVKLRMDLTLSGQHAAVAQVKGAGMAQEFFNANDCAAICRAIVRAAAAMVAK